MTKDQWKNELRNSSWVDTTYTPKQARQIRDAISELRAENILFIPTNNHAYQRVNEDTPIEVIEKFVHSQVRHLATQYFNTVIPFKNYVADEKLKDMMGQLSFLL